MHYFNAYARTRSTPLQSRPTKKFRPLAFNHLHKMPLHPPRPVPYYLSEEGRTAPNNPHMTNTNQSRTPSEARLRANRENAQKSTGPRSVAGKAASSRNRLLHGLRANKHLLLDDDPEQFVLLLNDLHSRFQPVGDGEVMIVRRIAADQWRLDRTFPMEAGIYRERLKKVAAQDAEQERIHAQQKKNAAYSEGPEPAAPIPPDADDRLARAFNIDCAGPNSLANLARYETAIERSIDRSLRQLKTFQSARQANAQMEQEQEQAHPPAEPATPAKSENCHSNPSPEGIHLPSVAAAIFLLCALLFSAAPLSAYRASESARRQAQRINTAPAPSPRPLTPPCKARFAGQSTACPSAATTLSLNGWYAFRPAPDNRHAVRPGRHAAL